MNHAAASAVVVALGLLGSCDFSLDGSISPKGTFVVDDGTDTNDITPGQEINVTLSAENVYLIDPSETPPAGHEDDAGHFQIYLDNLDDEPLVITAEVNVVVIVPASTEPGDHTLKCRIHKHDGTPTTTVIEVKIKVTVGAAGEGEGE